MIKNLPSNQLLLIAIAAVILLLAAFSFYLLQDPMAPLPFIPAPATSSSTPPPPALTIIPAPSAGPPTRQTSYTPRSAFVTPNLETPSTPALVTETTVLVTETPKPGVTTSPPGAPTNTPTVRPVNTQSTTSVTPSISPTVNPSGTETLSPGQHGVIGRVLQNGTPVVNVVLEFADDVAPRQTVTSPGGHYRFFTFAPGSNFTLTFDQADNLRLTPTPEVASLAWIEGTLPTGSDNIDLPDFEVSINLSGMFFDLLIPEDGRSFSAAVISASNKLQFSWDPYSQGGSYKVQLGPAGSDLPIWTSSTIAETSVLWNGTLDDGTHITQGSYWWRVSVTRSLGSYIFVAFAQPFDLVFTP